MTVHPAPSAPGPADKVQAGLGSAAKDGARQGVLSAFPHDADRVLVSGITPGFHVRGLGRDQVPVADWLCACGHHERARGRTAVRALSDRVTVGTCPHGPDTAALEGRSAA
jgi:hypothetical protein